MYENFLKYMIERSMYHYYRISVFNVKIVSCENCLIAEIIGYNHNISKPVNHYVGLDVFGNLEIIY